MTKPKDDTRNSGEMRCSTALAEEINNLKDKIAQNAADEFFKNTQNPYFADKPEALRDVLVAIIKGASFLMNGSR